jgi:hypothetical protein
MIMFASLVPEAMQQTPWRVTHGNCAVTVALLHPDCLAKPHSMSLCCTPKPVTCLFASLLQVLDYRQIRPSCEVLGHTVSLDSAMLNTMRLSAAPLLQVLDYRQIGPRCEVQCTQCTMLRPVVLLVGCLLRHCRCLTTGRLAPDARCNAHNVLC